MGFISGLFGRKEKIVRNIPRGPGAFELQDIYSIKGVGFIAVGRVLSGSIHTGQTAFVNGKKVTVKTIEMHHQGLEAAASGDNIGICLGGLSREDANALKRNPLMPPIVIDFA